MPEHLSVIEKEKTTLTLREQIAKLITIIENYPERAIPSFWPKQRPPAIKMLRRIMENAQQDSTPVTLGDLRTIFMVLASDFRQSGIEKWIASIANVIPAEPNYTSRGPNKDRFSIMYITPEVAKAVVAASQAALSAKDFTAYSEATEETLHWLSTVCYTLEENGKRPDVLIE